MSKSLAFTKVITKNSSFNQSNPILAFDYKSFCTLTSKIENKNVSKINCLSVRTDHKDYPSTIIGGNFTELVTKSTVFVDKTKLIEDVELSNCETMLLTFPRRWGKSVNLDMLAKFHAIQTDQQGNILEKKHTNNYKLFAGGVIKNMFGEIERLPSLNIATNPDMMMRQGQSPVIYLDLKDVPGDSHDNSLDGLKESLHNAWKQHDYLLNNKKLNKNHKKLAELYINPLRYEQLSLSKIKNGVKKLSELLYIYHGLKSKVMIDEYDSAINKAYINLFIDDQELNKIVNLYRDFLSPSLKNNQYLDKGVITGVFRLAKANIFSGLNNLSNFGVGDLEFAKYYGFTQQEVDAFLNAYNVDKQTSTKIKDWYNGYNVGDLEIYNPWSLVKCVSKYRHYRTNKPDFTSSDILRNYWGESGNINFITPLLKHKNIQEILEILLSKEKNEIIFSQIPELSVEDYSELRKMVSLGSNYNITLRGQEVLLSYLLLAGYLTKSNKDNYYVAANKEIKSELSAKLFAHYKALYNINPMLFANVTDQMQLMLDANNDEDLIKSKDGFVRKLTQLFSRLPKFKKIDKDRLELSDGEKTLHPNEDLIHSILNYIALQLKEVTHFATEVYLGKGYADILLVDENKKKSMVIELKYNQKDLDGAIRQIHEKQYLKPMPKDFTQMLLGVNINDNKEITAKIVKIPTIENLLLNNKNNNVNEYLPLDPEVEKNIENYSEQLEISGDNNDSGE